MHHRYLVLRKKYLRLRKEHQRVLHKLNTYEAFIEAIIATKPHMNKEQPIVEALLDKILENKKLRENEKS